MINNIEYIKLLKEEAEYFTDMLNRANKSDKEYISDMLNDREEKLKEFENEK